MKLTKRLLTPLLLIILGLGALINNFRPVHLPPVTPQRKATHMLTFYEQSNGFFGFGAGVRPTGLCTGTAIGPHAILTALHCDEDGKARILNIDYSTFRYHIVAAEIDNRDHLILLIDGPALTNIVPFEKLANVHPLRNGETVYAWGDGGGKYPAFYHEGAIASDAQEEDVSEVDQRQGLVYYTFAAIPGDSGSAIYGEDGRVVGVITYKINGQRDAWAAGFALNFTDEQIRYAEAFTPEWIAITPKGPVFNGPPIPIAPSPQQ